MVSTNLPLSLYAMIIQYAGGGGLRLPNPTDHLRNAVTCDVTGMPVTIAKEQPPTAGKAPLI